MDDYPICLEGGGGLGGFWRWDTYLAVSARAGNVVTLSFRHDDEFSVIAEVFSRYTSY